MTEITKVYKLLSQTDRHPKIVKNSKVGVLTWIMHLSPADRSGYEVCPMRSPGCTEACLNTAGKQWPGRNDKQAARIRRTKLFFEDRQEFMFRLYREIENAQKYAEKRGMLCGIRLNGTSDIPWENIPVDKSRPTWNLFRAFPNVRFYDYTKRANRKDLPPNYRLTFSRSEINEADMFKALDNGMNVAVVFSTRKGEELPSAWYPGGFVAGRDAVPVIDGDEHDFRYADYDEYPYPVIVGLRAKGKGIGDKSGFVVQLKGSE